MRLEHQHGPPALAHELQRPHRPRAVEVVLQSVFVCETVEAVGCRVLRSRKHGQHSGPVAVGGIAPFSAEDAFAILP